MNERTSIIIPALGEHLEGGYFHGLYLLNAEIWGEVSAPKAVGEISGLAWLPKYDDVPGAAHDFDGLGNTNAMADAGSPLAQAVRELRHGGFDDWHVPARGGQLLQWSGRAQLPAGEEFESAWYWSSTQYSRNDAYFQNFGNGYTYDYDKSWEGGRARAVRRFRIG